MKEEYQKNFGQEKIHHQQSFATELRISKQLYLRSFDVIGHLIVVKTKS